MRRYWIDEKYVSNESVELQGDSYHHICKVCRCGVGAKFEILANGKAYLVEITNLGPKSAQARVLEHREVQPLPKPLIHLVLSLPKFAVFEAVVEKAVEMGVYKIHPFTSQFSFLKDAEKISPEKWKRWEKIILSATQQCGRGELMSLQPIQTFEQVIKEFNRPHDKMGLFFYEGESSSDLQHVLQTSESQTISDIWLFIGSKGGFSEHEVAFMRQNNLNPISLGPQVLRVETACVATISVIKYYFGMLK